MKVADKVFQYQANKPANYLQNFNLQEAVSSFYEAEQHCQGLGAHLTSIHSSEESNNIKSNVPQVVFLHIFDINLNTSVAMCI